jgi:hypothetical protein
MKFVAYRSDDETAVYQYVRDNTDLYFDGLVRGRIQADPVGGGVWEVEVPYGVPDAATGGTPAGEDPPIPVTSNEGPAANQSLDPADPAMNGMEVSVDFSGQTKHITQSITTVHSVKRGGGVAPDFKRAIGVSKSGVAGCDVYAPHTEITITQKAPSFTLARLRTLQALVGRWNEQQWWGFEPGQALYLGGSGQAAQRGQWTFSHKVAVGENLVDVEVCEGLTLPSVDAWDYVWFFYADSVVDGLAVVLPDAAYVEQVYFPGDFSLLGVGV